MPSSGQVGAVYRTDLADGMKEMARVQGWGDVPSEAYLESALALTSAEADSLQAMLDQLPSRIIDAHTHVAERDEVVDAFPNELMLHPVSSYPAFGYEQAERARSALWPGKDVGSLRMAHAFRGFDYRAINRRLRNEAKRHADVFAAYGLPDDDEYTVEVIRGGGVAALKMYYSYRHPSFTTIDEIFPPAALDAAQEVGLPIILHLPRPLPATTAEVVELATSRSSLRIVLAHIGGHGAHFFDETVPGALAALAPCSNVLVDTALVFDDRLVAAALDALGDHRVLFGTDEPLSLLRVVSYRHPSLGPRFYAPKYHWAQEEGAPDDVSRKPAELLHLLQLGAVLRAARARGDRAVERVFFANASSAYGFA